MKNIDSDLIRGNIDTIILTTMLDGDKYGLDIIKEVETRSNGTYELKQPTLYSCLKRLENQELISSYWLDSDIGGRRHYYKLTEKGKDSLLQKQEEWTKSKFIIDNLLSNHDYDEYRLVKKEDYEKIIEGKQFTYNPEESQTQANKFESAQNNEQNTTNQNQPAEFEELKDFKDGTSGGVMFDDLEDADDNALDNENNFEQTELNDELKDKFAEDEFDKDANENELDDEEDSQEDFSPSDAETNYSFNENAQSQDKKINYLDDNDDAEADYPNQKRFKIPSIYDKINIDDAENLDNNDFYESEDTDSRNEANEDFDDDNSPTLEADDDEFDYNEYKVIKNASDDDFDDEEYTKSIYSQSENNDNDAEHFGLDTYDYRPDEEDAESDDTYPLSQEEINLGEDEENNLDDEDRVYFNRFENANDNEDEENYDTDLNINATNTNQSQNELNILSKLRGQENEEINEYYGDKNSYVNHLNKVSEIETLKSDDLNVVQEDLLSQNNYLSQSAINEQINDLSQSIKNLKEFSTEEPDAQEYSNDYEEQPANSSDAIDTEIEDELITNVTNQEESKNIIDFKNETNTDNYLDELEELKSTNNSGYFNSFDSANYANSNQPANENNFENNYGYNNENLQSFNEQIENFNNQYGYNTSKTESIGAENNLDETDYQNDDEQASFDSFNNIISKNVNDYSNDANAYISSNEEFKTFTPRFTENNYKQKLNDLSAYSKTSVDSSQPEKTAETNEDIMNKVKDIKTLKTEFASDGILVKEYKKSHDKSEEAGRNYLLINKLNLIKSLILLFGYVFLLSAVFIIMNNTSAQTIHNFSFKYFLFGFIPFIVYAIYHAVMFIFNPYKKVPAKYAPRIMIFIAVIITIQLLLITYCLNLQLGFYSFSQTHYNHLIWVIPTIISFAPIISTLIHMALYYSKNFNV